jgi:hypothetical protein
VLASGVIGIVARSRTSRPIASKQALGAWFRVVVGLVTLGFVLGSLRWMSPVDDAAYAKSASDGSVQLAPSSGAAHLCGRNILACRAALPKPDPLL